MKTGDLSIQKTPTAVDDVVRKDYVDGIRQSSHKTILPWNYSSITQGTWTLEAEDITMVFCGYLRNSTSAQNDQLNYIDSFEAGTWTFRFLTRKNTNSPIIHLLIDTVDVGTVDTYGGDLKNQLVDITGIVLTAGLHTIGLKMSTKHASSSSYMLYFQAIGAWRTA